MTADEVARYLSSHPAFFEQYADLLTQIQVPHPHGGHAIALSDRQVLSLRAKNRALETKLTELIAFGEENDALSEKAHRLAVTLVAVAEIDAVLSALYSSLREDFQVPHVAIRLWRGAGVQPEFAPVSPALRSQVAELARPLCGPNTALEPVGWFAVGREHIRSMALIPLRAGGTAFGLLTLAAEDAQRFYADMGTLYVERVGDLAAAALARHL